MHLPWIVVFFFVHFWRRESAIRVSESDQVGFESLPDDEIILPERNTSRRAGTGILDRYFGRNLRVSFETEQKDLAGSILKEGEQIRMAFRTKRTTTFFTTDRILYRTKQGWFGLNQWTTVPYSTIKAWSIQTTGKYWSQSTALKLWTSATSPEAKVLHMNFRNRTRSDESMLLDVHAYLTKKLMGLDIEQERFSQIGERWTWSWWLWWRSYKSFIYNSSAMEATLRKSVPLLGPPDQESVKFAYKTGRDFKLWTTRRLITIDVKYFTGRTAEFKSVPWSEVATWFVDSAEIFDSSSELSVSTTIPGWPIELMRVRPSPQEEYIIHRIMAEQMLDATENGTTELRFLPSFLGNVPPIAGKFFTHPPKVTAGENFSQICRQEAPGLLNEGEKPVLGVEGTVESLLLTDQR